MTDWFAVWLFSGIAIALIWFLRFIAVELALRRRRVLSHVENTDPFTEVPRVSVVVAARDEEENIEACVTSLLAQDYPNLEIIVANDRSRDRTAGILAELQQHAPHRLRVVTVHALPGDWYGKPHAMHIGVMAATGDWLLFSDADCRFDSPRAISLAVAEADRQDTDFLSLTPQLDAPTIWEKILQPVCLFVLMLWFQPSRVNNPRCATAYANGAFMLLRRRCYETLGGHVAVRREINEDIALARAAKGAGFRLLVVESEGLLRTRMYPTPHQAWRGWSRIFFGCLRSPLRIAAGLAQLVVAVIGPWASLIVSGATVFHEPNDADWRMALVAWFSVVALMQFVLGRLYAVLSLGRLWSLTYVLGGVVTAGILINALAKSLGATSTVWRGTNYPATGLGGAESSVPASLVQRAAADGSVPQG